MCFFQVIEGIRPIVDELGNGRIICVAGLKSLFITGACIAGTTGAGGTIGAIGGTGTGVCNR